MNFMRFGIFLLLLSVTAWHVDVCAVERFEITGTITKKDIERFDQFMKDNPSTTEILFTNSIGAHDDGVIIVHEFKNRIDELKLKTFVRGLCASACANIFLLGHERTMLANVGGRPSMLLLHPVRWVTPENEGGVGQIKVQMTDEINQEISKRSGGKLTIDLLNKMYGADDSSGGIFILRDGNSMGKHVLFSPSIKKNIRANPISDLRLQDLGISIAE